MVSGNFKLYVYTSILLTISNVPIHRGIQIFALGILNSMFRVDTKKHFKSYVIYILYHLVLANIFFSIGQPIDVS